MTCRKIHRLLSVRRELVPAEQALVRVHLVSCPACQAVAREYELIDRRLGRLRQPMPALATTAGARARAITVEQTIDTQAVSMRRQALQGLALMAVAALILGAALLWRAQNSVEVSEPVTLPANPPRETLPDTAPPQVARQDTPAAFVWPTVGSLSQTYWTGHRAVDIASQMGAPVVAAADGTVVLVDSDAVNGIHVLLDHGDGVTTFYAHLAVATVLAGDEVQKSQQIGTVGTTGRSTGPHLHFEIRKDGEPLNPFELLEGDGRSVGMSPAPGAKPEATALPADAGGFIWPVSGQVSQVHWIGHRAVDIASQLGMPVYAAADGTVILSDRDDDRHGIHVLVDHGDGRESFYSHLSAARVRVGEQVSRGQQIGAVGNTGLSTGPHLHFEIRKDGVRLNPFDFLPELQQ